MLCGIMLSAGIYAQERPQQEGPPKTPEERADNITKRLTKELALTADQQTKVKAIVLERESEMKKDREAAKANRDKHDAEMKAVLTPDQYQKFEAKKAEMEQKRKQQRANGERGPKGPKDPAPANAPDPGAK